jgi:hypothetical protein
MMFFDQIGQPGNPLSKVMKTLAMLTKLYHHLF